MNLVDSYCSESGGKVMKRFEYFQNLLNNFKYEDFKNIPTKNNLGNDLQKNLFFLDSYIDFLEKENMQKDYPTSFYDAVKLCYSTVDQADFKNEKDKVYFTKRWINTCMSYETDSLVRYYFDNKESKQEQDPEEQLKLVLFGNGKVRTEFENEKWKKSLLGIFDWYLDRYDIFTAKIILESINGQPTRTSKFFINIYNNIMIAISLIVLITTLLLSIFNISFSFSQLRFLPIIAAPNLKIEDSSIAAILVIVYLILLPFLILSVAVILKKKKNRVSYFTSYLSLLSPRLLNGIFIGFLPIIVPGDFWKMVVHLQVLPFIIIIFIALSISYVFLEIIIERTVVDISKARKRTMFIFCWGLFISLITGLIINDIFALPMLNSFGKEFTITQSNFDVTVCGVFGIVVPKIVIFFSSIGLLVGIIVQLIWEEKPISHSI